MPSIRIDPGINGWDEPALLEPGINRDRLAQSGSRTTLQRERKSSRALIEDERAKRPP
jgi:hypothetical protein